MPALISLEGQQYAEFSRIIIHQLPILKMAALNRGVGNRQLLEKTKGYSAHNALMQAEDIDNQKLDLYPEDCTILAEAMNCFRRFAEEPELAGVLKEDVWEHFLEAADFLEQLLPEAFKKKPGAAPKPPRKKRGAARSKASLKL